MLCIPPTKLTTKTITISHGEASVECIFWMAENTGMSVCMRALVCVCVFSLHISPDILAGSLQVHNSNSRGLSGNYSYDNFYPLTIYINTVSTTTTIKRINSNYLYRTRKRLKKSFFLFFFFCKSFIWTQDSKITWKLFKMLTLNNVINEKHWTAGELSVYQHHCHHQTILQGQN